MPNDEVKVEQIDREAAAAFYGKYLARPGEVPVEAAFRVGHVDESPLIQALARHRLAARPAPAEDAVEVTAGMVAHAMAEIGRLSRQEPDLRLEGLCHEEVEGILRAALAAMQPRGEQQAGREEGR
jgi:hypothetical protein